MGSDLIVRDYGRFVREFLLHPNCVGAIAPSSPGLALRMVQWIDWESVSTVVEYGPGTGALTSQILQHRRPDTKFFAVELNSEFAATLANRFPDLTILQDSVGNIEETLPATRSCRSGCDRLRSAVGGVLR